MKKFFTTSDLFFVATALLTTNGITIERVVFHETKQNIKVFYLAPAEVVHQIHLQYVSGVIQVSPFLLSQKIMVIKNLHAEMPEKGRSF